MNKERLSSKEAIFPIVVLVASVFALYKQTYFLNIPSFVVSLVGIVGVWLFYKNNKYFQPLFFVWILAQLVIIDRVTLHPSGVSVYSLYWDATQGVSLKFGIFAGSTFSKTTVHINILSILFLIVFRLLRISGLVGTKLTFYKFKEDSVFADVFPVTGSVFKRIEVAEEKDWLLVTLDKPIIYNEKQIFSVIIKRKDGGILKPSMANQVIYFRLVDNTNDLFAKADIKKFPFLEWVLCK